MSGAGAAARRYRGSRSSPGSGSRLAPGVPQGRDVERVEAGAARQGDLRSSASLGSGSFDGVLERSDGDRVSVGR